MVEDFSNLISFVALNSSLLTKYAFLQFLYEYSKIELGKVEWEFRNKISTKCNLRPGKRVRLQLKFGEKR